MPSPAAPAPRPGLRFAALAWSVLHAPLFLWLYAGPMADAVHAAPPAFRAALWPTYAAQAGVLSLAVFLAALPLSPWPRLYRRAAPGVAALATAALFLDSRVFAAVGFHLNGFFFRVLFQRNALQETGVPVSDVVLLVGGAAALVAAEVSLGARALDRLARPRRAWAWALALLLAGAGERVYSAALSFLGGQAVFAAGGVLPLVPPVRMVDLLAALTGHAQADPFAGAGAAALRLPPTIPPSRIRFERRPDVLLVLAESLPAAHLDPSTMPHLWARAAQGARFTRHYSTGCSTNFALFSVLYGIQAQKLDATVGAGREALLFPALRENGYQSRFLAASCVDWMGMAETVFGPVSGDLETWCHERTWDRIDARMLASARRWVAAADRDRPMFLFLFFDGTHYDYHYPEAEGPFRPAWDGRGGIEGSTAPSAAIENRARNAAHYLDGELEGFLAEVERLRGRRPIVLFTGDHGEEFRQKGHIGHGSDVTDEQIHVPFVVAGPGVPRGVFDHPTSHVDIVPTLFALLGDRNAPAEYSDGMSAFDAGPDRYVLATVGWEPKYAAMGQELKVTMFAGRGTAITDLDDRPLPDGPARLARDAGRILQALRGGTSATGAARAALPAAAPAAMPSTAAPQASGRRGR